eukprot:1518651-Alexandrium_andersonii.AAC.1
MASSSGDDGHHGEHHGERLAMGLSSTGDQQRSPPADYVDALPEFAVATPAGAAPAQEEGHGRTTVAALGARGLAARQPQAPANLV